MRLTIGKQIPVLCKSILLFLLSCVILLGCTKPDEPITPEQRVMLYITGSGNRYWRIKEIYVNKVPVALTTSQLDYNKTYTTYGYSEAFTGVFSDANGSIGIWELKGTQHILETITNNPGGNIKLDLTINHIDANNMDVEYTANGTTVRSVYFAY